jgi:hypothetical protein
VLSRIRSHNLHIPRPEGPNAATQPSNVVTCSGLGGRKSAGATRGDAAFDAGFSHSQASLLRRRIDPLSHDRRTLRPRSWASHGQLIGRRDNNGAVPKRSGWSGFLFLERTTGFEPATPTLANHMADVSCVSASLAVPLSCTFSALLSHSSHQIAVVD